MTSTPILDRAWLRHVLGVQAFPMPRLWVGAQLRRTAEGGVEVAGGAHVRVPAQAWLVGEDGAQGVNVDAIEWPVARGDWGTVTHCGLYDAPSGGGELLWGEILELDGLTPAPVPVRRGDCLRIGPGRLVVRGPTA